MELVRASRFSWDESAMLSAFAFSMRSVCLHHKVGAIILSQGHQLIGEGYNGPPGGINHCSEVGCAKKTDQGNGQNGDCVGLHAEENAIVHAYPRLLPNATIYITLQPCVKCACRIVQQKIGRVVAAGKYMRVGTDKDNRTDETFQTEKILREGGGSI